MSTLSMGLLTKEAVESLITRTRAGNGAETRKTKEEQGKTALLGMIQEKLMVSPSFPCGAETM